MRSRYLALLRERRWGLCRRYDRDILAQRAFNRLVASNIDGTSQLTAAPVGSPCERSYYDCLVTCGPSKLLCRPVSGSSLVGRLFCSFTLLPCNVGIIYDKPGLKTVLRLSIEFDCA